MSGKQLGAVPTCNEKAKKKKIAHFRAPSNTLLPPVIKWQMESPIEDINMHLDQIVIQLCL